MSGQEATQDIEKTRNKYTKTKLNKYREDYKWKQLQKKHYKYKTNRLIQFIYTLNDRSNPDQIWNKIIRIQYRSSSQMSILRMKKVLSSNFKKADVLADKYFNIDRLCNYPTKFRKHNKELWIYEKHNNYIKYKTKSDSE